MKPPRSVPLAALAPVLALLLWVAAADAQAPAGGDAAEGAHAGQAVAQAYAGHADADQAIAGHADACDPAVAEALAKSAQAGVEADLAIIRHPDQGIRNPDSILDFSCIGDLFDYRAFDVLFDPAGALEDILDLARRRVCAAARDAYRRYLGRALDASVFTVPGRLPGLGPDRRTLVPGTLVPGTLVPQRRNVLEDAEAQRGDSELFRSVVGDTRAGGGQ